MNSECQARIYPSVGIFIFSLLALSGVVYVSSRHSDGLIKVSELLHDPAAPLLKSSLLNFSALMSAAA